MHLSQRLNFGSSRRARAKFPSLFKRFFDNFPARSQIVILSEVGENIVAIFLRHPVSPFGKGLFRYIGPQRVAISTFLPCHLALTREKPVDKHSRAVGVRRAVDERDRSGART